ncbi:MAG: hypothetical protein QOH35_3027 [Acidobacteriaceae bacterium]|jgi:hypothetical protein|nr:hypothetical protein [Acidobacteriaceae bacterium]
MAKRLGKAEEVDFRARQIAWQVARETYRAAHPEASEAECRRAATETCWRVVLIPSYKLPSEGYSASDERSGLLRFSDYQGFTSLRKQSD